MTSQSLSDGVEVEEAVAVASAVALVSTKDTGIVPKRSSFIRRNSIDNLSSLGKEPIEVEHNNSDGKMDHADEDDSKFSSAAAPGSPAAVAPPTKTVARICGSWRSKCGYCRGKRLHVLEVSDAFNKCLISTREQQQQQHTTTGADAGEHGELTSTKQVENTTSSPLASPTSSSSSSSSSSEQQQPQPHIDANHTSKSYGLLFDHLPYEMYETFVNRGWRRSGQDLYRPHTFESCCPAISIRLDVWKFGGGDGNRSSTATATPTTKALPLPLMCNHYPHPRIIIIDLM
jgi:hypothetical protein